MSLVGDLHLFAGDPGGNIRLRAQPQLVEDFDRGVGLDEGGVVQFSAVGVYTDGSNQTVTDSVTWSVSAGGVATLGSSPNTSWITAQLAGTATVSATLGGGPTITPVTMTVTAQTYAYVTNFSSDRVSQYPISVPAQTQPSSISIGY